MKLFGDILDSIKNDSGEEFEAYENYGIDLEDDEDDDEEESVKKAGNFFRRKKAKEYDYDLDETPKSEPKAARVTSKITPITRKRTGSNVPEVHVVKPVSFEDAREVTEKLREGQIVVINLQGLDVVLAQRIVDYSVGTSEGLDGNFGVIANFIYIITPAGVEISGELETIVRDAFEIPDIKTDF